MDRQNVIIPSLIAKLRSDHGLTQEQLAKHLGVSFATVNRWETGKAQPRPAVMRRIEALAARAAPHNPSAPTNNGAARRDRRARGNKAAAATTKPMEQMLWDAACSIRGEKDAPRFKDFLLPLLFLKRLSDVFDDEIARLTGTFGTHEKALQMAELDHSLVRFYVPPVARWRLISGRENIEWPEDEKPRDIGEHLTRAVRAVAKQNLALSGVIDVEDFAAERNGERDINPAKLRAVVETFSDPRYRLGLNDVAPDFLGNCYEYLLRKFAEGSGQSAGEFFTPTNVGFLMAHIIQPQPGETCHDYACGSAGLLIKLQLLARQLHDSNVPLKLYGQELQAESFAVAKMNGIIHDLDIEMMRGDSMINPKLRNPDGSLRVFDIVVANPMWNQPFAKEIYENDPFRRFAEAGGVTSGKGDWAWLQHTLACLNGHGRAAVVLDTGTATRGSGSKSEDRERSIRKWFVDNDFIEAVILLPDNLFYNTSAAGIIVVLNKRKARDRQGKIILVNATRRFEKGRPKNYLPTDGISAIAAQFIKGEPIAGEVAIISKEQAQSSDYNLSPSRWVSYLPDSDLKPIGALVDELELLEVQSSVATSELLQLLASVSATSQADSGISNG
jgi:type I restriction enzyme M protein